MASMALGAVGSAMGGPIGGFIGSAIGSMIDNAIMPGTRVEGPRLNDLRVQSAAYGVTMPVIYGPENRVAGAVIWSTGILETKHKNKSNGKGGPSVTQVSYTYRTSLAVLLADRECHGLKQIYANGKLIYDRDGTGSPPVTKSVFASVRFYKGTADQMPDALIESHKGAGNAPAYRHACYMVLEDLQLADFGNVVPNLEIVLEADQEITLTGVVLDIVKRSGIDPNDVSTSGLPAVNVRGYALAGSARAWDALQPLGLTYNFDAAEQGGGVRFIRRGRAPLAYLSLGEMGIYDRIDSEVPEPIRYTRADVTSLPREAVLTYSDPDRNFQANAQPARRQFGNAENNLKTEVPIVLDTATAAQAAERMLYEAWVSRTTAEFMTLPRWRFVIAGDAYVIPTPDGPQAFRLKRLQRGVNGVLSWSVTMDDPLLYQSNATGVAAALPPQEVLGVPAVEIVLLDIPLLMDADAAKAEGFYYGVVASGSGWRGASVERSLTVSDPFSEFDAVGDQLTLGVGITSLDAMPQGFDAATEWDTDSVLSVRLRRGDMELESLTDAEVLAGGNAAYIGPLDGHGGEIVQFASATLQPDGSYILSRFRRGQKGTEYLATAHGTGQLFVLLEPGALRRATFGLSELNVSRAYRAVSVLQSPDDAAKKVWTNTGTGLRPYGPVDLEASRPVGGDASMTWTRRSRVGWPAMNPPPLEEESEAYILRIMNAAGTSVVREVPLTAPSYTYAAGDQAADFGGTPPAALRWRVAQVSAVYGPGTFTEKITTF